VGAARLSANKFLVGLTSQYSAIYTVGLGADSVQLGSLSSVGGAISSWLPNCANLKRDNTPMRPGLALWLISVTFSRGGGTFGDG